MGMIGNVLRVTNDELKAYLENSSLLENRIYDEEREDDDTHLDIDKAWEGILFLVTGEGLATLEHPMGKILFSGQLINEDQDLGYGPAHYLTPEQVKEVDAELSSLTVEELVSKFNAAQMTELGIYPEIWEEEDAFDYLLEYFKQVQEVYSIASKGNEAIITYIC